MAPHRSSQPWILSQETEAVKSYGGFCTAEPLGPSCAEKQFYAAKQPTKGSGQSKQSYPNDKNENQISLNHPADQVFMPTYPIARKLSAALFGTCLDRPEVLRLTLCKFELEFLSRRRLEYPK